MRIPINFKKWLDDNRETLKPPVCNQVVWKNTEFIIMVVGGPNSRKDYHVDVSEELFYQIKGNMLLKIIENGTSKDIKISEGELFLLPPRVPHSPQRFKDTIGIVIERTRNKGELDGFQWYCDECNALLYEEYLPLTDIVKQLPPIFEGFWNNDAVRTCKSCSDYLEKP